MFLVLGAVVGTVIGFILMIRAFIDKSYLEGVVILVLAPILYGVTGAALNALMAWLYNLVAARLGGIEISLED